MIAALTGGGGGPALWPASVLLDGEYGLRDVALGVPAWVGPGGVRGVEEWSLEPAELGALREAGRVVAAAADALAPAR
jgi:malate dehydrogenase